MEKAALAKLKLKFQGTDEERACAELLFNDVHLSMGDNRLNHIAALTWNIQSCKRIFNILSQSLVPADFSWQTLFNALLILHTVVLYGSEHSVDLASDLRVTVNGLQSYNSALVKRGLFFSSPAGGTDFGAPVRMQAKLLTTILANDASIRKARIEAREGETSLVPMGTQASSAGNGSSGSVDFFFGQGMEKAVGAKFSMEAVPGMYEGRPERYFDDQNDVRAGTMRTGDHQFTREVDLYVKIFDNTYFEEIFCVLIDLLFRTSLCA